MDRILVYFFFLLLPLLPFVTTIVVPTGMTVYMNGIPYHVSPHATGHILLQSQLPQDTKSTFGFLPVSIIPHGTQTPALHDLIRAWGAVDDVFQPGFTSVILNETSSSNDLDRPMTLNLTGQGLSTLVGFTSKKTPAKGPYFLEMATGKIHKVYRLYDDFAGTFNEALLANPDGTFQTLSAKIPGSATLTIGVPSRLYYEASPSQPLAGVRIAVKDIFSLAGVKNSNGNRAWYHIYPPSNRTAVTISRLIQAGAIVVGTQKLSQFATSEVATVDWVDYHSPFNPRGDGYQDPSSSSSGAGASIASYDWLDAAVGTDTGGSIRSPAGVTGVFGNRPSHGLVSLADVMPLSEPLDTAGFLVRDPALWDRLQAVMYGANYKSLSALKTLRYPTRIQTVGFPNSSTEAGRLLSEFAMALARFVNGSAETLDVAQRWAAMQSNRPSDNVSLAVMLNTTYPILTGQGQTAKVVEPFLADYAAQHEGRRPFINPAPLARWAWARPYSWSEAIRNKTIFMEWFNREILPTVDDPSRCSSGLVLYPGKVGTETPRNQYGTAPPAPFLGFSPARMSVFAECPDFILPVGEVPVMSRITGHLENLPVAVGILAAKGCDGLLTRLAMDLVEAGLLRLPKVGGSVYGGPILH